MLYHMFYLRLELDMALLLLYQVIIEVIIDVAGKCNVVEIHIEVLIIVKLNDLAGDDDINHESVY